MALGKQKTNAFDSNNLHTPRRSAKVSQSREKTRSTPAEGPIHKICTQNVRVFGKVLGQCRSPMCSSRWGKIKHDSSEHAQLSSLPTQSKVGLHHRCRSGLGNTADQKSPKIQDDKAHRILYLRNCSPRADLD